MRKVMNTIWVYTEIGMYAIAILAGATFCIGSGIVIGHFISKYW